MRGSTLLLTLSLLLAHASPSCGDWFYDFDDGVIPGTLTTYGWLQGGPPFVSSPTSQASADGGFLRLWDSESRSPNQGGTFEGDADNTEVFHGDVRVSALINPAGTTNDWMGFWARETTKFANYHGGFSFGGSNGGRLFVGKGIPDGPNELFMTTERVTDLARSYFFELTVVDDPISGYPEVTAGLFDQEGGAQLLEKSFIDDGLLAGSLHTSGSAGIWAAAFDDNVLDATLDNIRAESLPIPEPLLGDLNLDGEVNGLDVDPFVDVLLNGPYQAEADMNEDQVVNGLDVDSFVAAVLGGVHQVPEPSTLLLCLVALGTLGGCWRPAR